MQGTPQDLGEGQGHLRLVEVRGLAAAQHQVVLPDLPDRGRQNVRGRSGVQVLEGRVLGQHQVVRAHGQRLLDDVHRKLGPRAEHGDLPLLLLPDAERGLNSVLVEAVDHGGNVGGRLHPLRHRGLMRRADAGVSGSMTCLAVTMMFTAIPNSYKRMRDGLMCNLSQASGAVSIQSGL